MKPYLVTLFSLFLLVATFAQQPAGSSCEDAIVVGSSYSATITTPGDYWYQASTYDLPIILTFTPSMVLGGGVLGSDGKPQIYLDFTCTPGVYTDSIMSNLFDPNNGTYIEMPYNLTDKLEVHQEDGVRYYTLSISEQYRETMSAVGLTYDVDAFVHVIYTQTGTVNLAPDTVYRDCVENQEFFHLGDSALIFPNDSSRSFVFPYSEWREDSIRIVWNSLGNHPATVYVDCSDCSFRPTAASPTLVSLYNIPDKGFEKLTPADIQSDIDFFPGGGVFYGKVLTAGSGYLKVEKIPEFIGDGNGVLLEYNKPVTSVSDSDSYFYFPTSWDASVQFSASRSDTVRMVVAKSHNFTCSPSHPDVLAVYEFAPSADEPLSTHTLSAGELASLTQQASGNYLFVRFQSVAPLQITPSLWTTGPCMSETRQLSLNKPMPIAARSGNTVVYRIRYADIEGADSLIVSWDGSVNCPVYMAADTCRFTLSSSNVHLLRTGTQVSGYMSVSRTKSVLRDSLTIASWAESAAENDGYLYARINPTAAGNITWKVFTSHRAFPMPLPDDTIPVIPDDTIPVDPDIQPIQPITPEQAAAVSVAMLCDPASLDIVMVVTEPQDLVLYDQFGHPVWQQLNAQPGTEYHFTPQCGVQYVLRGKSHTIHILR